MKISTKPQKFTYCKAKLGKGKQWMDHVVDFIKQLYKHIIAADTFGFSAQLAFFFLLSLFPFLIFLITLLGFLPIDDHTLMDFLEAYTPHELMIFIETNVSELINAPKGGLLSFGIIGTIWSASNGVNAITRAFNRAYEVREDRSFLVARLIAVILTVAMVVVIAIALLLPVFGKMIGVYLFSFVDLSEDFLRAWNTLRWIASSVVLFIVLLVLYRIAPNHRVTFKNAVGGALFAMIGWQLVSLAFSYFVDTLGNYSATYGSLGTVIVLMIWFYLTGIIIIIGGVINAVLAKRKSLF